MNKICIISTLVIVSSAINYISPRAIWIMQSDMRQIYHPISGSRVYKINAPPIARSCTLAQFFLAIYYFEGDMQNKCGRCVRMTVLNIVGWLKNVYLKYSRPTHKPPTIDSATCDKRNKNRHTRIVIYRCCIRPEEQMLYYVWIALDEGNGWHQ